MKPGIIYSYVNRIGDVMLCAVDDAGTLRELAALATGPTVAWKPGELDRAASTLLGADADEGAALRWVVGA